MLALGKFRDSQDRKSIRVGRNTRETIFQKSAQLLAYANDIDVMGRRRRDVIGAFASIETGAAKMVMIVNEGKAILAVNKDFTKDRHSFDVIRDYLLPRIPYK